MPTPITNQIKLTDCLQPSSARSLFCDCDAFLRKFKIGFVGENSNLFFDDIRSFTLEIMGVNASHPLGGTKVKYVHASSNEDPRRNSDENEEFLSESSKRKEAGLFQFKSRKGKSKCTFDSLNTIDSRKSDPYAALPDTTRASSSSPSGDNGHLHCIFSNEVSTNVSSKNSRVFFTNEVPTEAMEQDGVFTENGFTEGFHKKTNQSSGLGQRNISSNSQGETIHVRTISHDTHKGLVARRESEL